MKILTLLYMSGNFPDFWTETVVSKPKNISKLPDSQISVKSNFSANSELQFSVLTPGQVEISVYNINGQRTSGTQNRFVSAGIHKIPLKSLTGGTYLVKMRKSGTEVNKRVTMVK